MEVRLKFRLNEAPTAARWRRLALYDYTIKSEPGVAKAAFSPTRGGCMSSRSREFELAVKTFSGELYRFAFWLARDRHAAEDLVQECFQRAWANWESLNDPITLKKWLFTILRREFLRRLERKQLHTIDIDGLELAADALGMDEIYALRQALASAPDNLREPLLMQVLGGFTAEELAVIHQSTPGAMAVRLSRARQWLRQRLTGGDASAGTTLGRIK
jgi:RNA polymerase sigma-70 factor (ECF subfamily)